MSLIKIEKPVLSSVAEGMFRSFFDEPAFSSTNTWRPAMDVVELDQSYEITFSLPGFRKQDIHVSMNNNTLTLKASHVDEKKEDKGNYLYREIAYGTFERSIYLPENVDEDKISANYKDGLLRLTIAKKEEVLPKEIEIKLK